MAARMLQRRVISLIAHNNPPSSLSLRRESSKQLFPSVSALFRRKGYLRRWIQSVAEAQPLRQADEAGGKCDLADVPSNTISSNANPRRYDFSKLKSSPRHDRVMVFTCKVCDTRSMKSLSLESYEKGVVVARCDGCDNLHLIADRLGMFGEPGSVEEYLASRGEEVKKGSIDTINLTLEDIAGKVEDIAGMESLGMFGEPGSGEEYLASREEEVKKGSFDPINLPL